MLRKKHQIPAFVAEEKPRLPMTSPEKQPMLAEPAAAETLLGSAARAAAEALATVVERDLTKPRPSSSHDIPMHGYPIKEPVPSSYHPLAIEEAPPRKLELSDREKLKLLKYLKFQRI